MGRSVLARRGGKGKVTHQAAENEVLTLTATRGGDKKAAVSPKKDKRRKVDERPRTPPRPWKLEEHPDAPGEWYYWNEKTGETTWDPPVAVLSICDGHVSLSGRPPSPLPPWKLAEHPDAPGEWYFLNEETGVTTWDEPEGAYGSR